MPRDQVGEDQEREEYAQGSGLFNHADVLLAYIAGATSGRKHAPSDELIARAADAYVKSVSPPHAGDHALHASQADAAINARVEQKQ